MVRLIHHRPWLKTVRKETPHPGEAAHLPPESAAGTQRKGLLKYYKIKQPQRMAKFLLGAFLKGIFYSGLYLLVEGLKWPETRQQI